MYLAPVYHAIAFKPTASQALIAVRSPSRSNVGPVSLRGLCVTDGIEGEPGKGGGSRLTTPSPEKKGQLTSDFPPTTESHLPLKAARFQPGDRPAFYPEGKLCCRRGIPFRAWSSLSRFGLNKPGLARPSWSRAIRALLVCKRKPNAQGTLKGLFLGKYDSLKKAFLLPSTLSMRKLIFLTTITLRSSCSHFPLGSILGGIFETTTPWR